MFPIGRNGDQIPVRQGPVVDVGARLILPCEGFHRIASNANGPSCGHRKVGHGSHLGSFPSTTTMQAPLHSFFPGQ